VNVLAKLLVEDKHTQDLQPDRPKRIVTNKQSSSARVKTVKKNKIEIYFPKYRRNYPRQTLNKKRLQL